MTSRDRDLLREQLTDHEGTSRRLYKCPAGFWTIGCGRNLEANGLRDSEVRFLLDNDITDVLGFCSGRLPWFDALDVVRQRAIADLVFNMGGTKYLTFVKHLRAMEAKHYDVAGAELVDSKWYTDVGPLRAKRIVRMVQTGVDPGYGRQS